MMLEPCMLIRRQPNGPTWEVLPREQWVTPGYARAAVVADPQSGWVLGMVCNFCVDRTMGLSEFVAEDSFDSWARRVRAEAGVTK